MVFMSTNEITEKKVGLPPGWYWRQGPTLRAERPAPGGGWLEGYCEWDGTALSCHGAPAEVVNEVLRVR